MASEHRPRQHRIMNPEQCAAILRRLVTCWDADDNSEFIIALAEARQLLGIVPDREQESE